jgi:hypothetical protein
MVCAYILGWPASMTFVAGAIFGMALVMTAVTIQKAKP